MCIILWIYYKCKVNNGRAQIHKVLRFVSGLLKDLKYFSIQVAIFARFAHDVMAAMLEEFKQKNLINSCCIRSIEL